MLCCLSDSTNILVFINLEVSILPNQKVIPITWGRSFNTNQKKKSIKALCEAIKKPKDISYVEVHPINKKGETMNIIRYYIESEEFIIGYTTMLAIAKSFIADY